MQKALPFVIVAIAIVFAIGLNTQKPETNKRDNAPVAEPQNQAQDNTVKIEDEVVGTGTTAVAGKSVTVNYTGTLTNGTKFDSSFDHNQTFTFNLGTGEVIEGWDQGVVGMKVGGKRKLTIPPSLGYGAQDIPKIPANSTLIFEIELLDVK